MREREKENALELITFGAGQSDVAGFFANVSFVVPFVPNNQILFDFFDDAVRNR